jgi:hypothetical protein
MFDELTSSATDTLSVIKQLVPEAVRDWLGLGTTALCVLLFVCGPLRRTSLRLLRFSGRGVRSLFSLFQSKPSELLSTYLDLLHCPTTQLEKLIADGSHVIKCGPLVIDLGCESSLVSAARDPKITFDNVDQKLVLTSGEHKSLLKAAEQVKKAILKSEREQAREDHQYRALVAKEIAQSPLQAVHVAPITVDVDIERFKAEIERTYKGLPRDIIARGMSESSKNSQARK